MKTDYFVFPQDHADYLKLVEAFGEKPKQLRVLIPVEDEEAWASQYYKAYNQTYGLVCKGNGETALRMADANSGELPKARLTETVTLKEIPCAGRECPDYQDKKCHEVMNLRFILPEVPGLGIWQIDTGSKNSILNINSCAKIIKQAFGRISMIPLQLTFEPIQVNNPDDGKKQTVYVMNLRSDVTLARLADDTRKQAKTFMLEAATLEGSYDIEAEKEIDELWGEDNKSQVKPVEEVAVAAEFCTMDQRKKIFAVADAMGYDKVSLKAIMARKFNTESTKELSVMEAGELIEFMLACLKNCHSRLDTIDSLAERIKFEVRR